MKSPATIKKPTDLAIVDEIDALSVKDAGQGVSTAAEDNLVPLVRRLQALSPQVNKRGPDYVKGAEAGDIWLKDEEPAIIKGDDGFVFQPCAFSKDVVEWRPRETGGGLVGRHETIPRDAIEASDPATGRAIFTRPNGNLLVDTRYHAGLIHLPDGRRLPYVIPMKSTDHTISRQWMVRMNAKKIPASNLTSPAYRYLYLIRTKERSNAAGTWSTWDITDHAKVTVLEDYLTGKALSDAWQSGTKTAAVEDEPEVEDVL